MAAVAAFEPKQTKTVTHVGRQLEYYGHGTDPAWGAKNPNQQDTFAVLLPKTGPRKGAPLYVVLHSAGHNLWSCLDCQKTPHNHDLYTPPADFYALYLDCATNRGTDWWWGQNGAGLEETPVEKRVIATVLWTVKKYGIDPNRVYLSGISMGGSGTLGIGLRHGDIFAAIKANVPAIEWFEHPMKSLGLPPYALPEGTRLPDPPVTVDYSSQIDHWSIGHERLIAGMRDRKYGWMLFWGAYGHANADAWIAKKNDIINAFDWLSVRLDQPYPAFTDATTDTPSPWPDDLKGQGAGQINGFFRWEEPSADDKGVGLVLRLATAGELRSRIFQVPGRSTATLTLRRLGKFAVKPGDRLAWTFGEAKGEITVGADGLVTIPSLTVTATPKRLEVVRK